MRDASVTPGGEEFSTRTNAPYVRFCAPALAAGRPSFPYPSSGRPRHDLGAKLMPFVCRRRALPLGLFAGDSGFAGSSRSARLLIISSANLGDAIAAAISLASVTSRRASVI